MAETDPPIIPVPVPVVVTTKPGWRTTEFWLTAAAQVLGLLIMAGLIHPDQPSNVWDKAAGAAILVLSNLGYQVMRGIVKKAALQPTAPLVDFIPKK